MPRQLVGLTTWVVCFFVANVAVADEATWLAKHIPPKYEGGTPFTIKKIEINRNHVDQELIRADFTRTPEIVRVLPKEVKLIILPVGGGRYEAWADNGIAVSPQQSGAINGITDLLIDYRGKIPGGARAYIEMTAANALKKQDPVRISNIFWIGTPAELKAAQKKDPADPSNAELKSIALKEVGTDTALPAGIPVRLAGGQHSYKGALVEKGVAGRPLKVVLYLARPGGLYLPWYIDANPSDVKVEAAALEAAKAAGNAFNESLREVKARISQGNAPFTLKPVGKTVKKGDKVVWFGIHGLMGGELLEDSSDGRAKVRDSRFMEESVLTVEQLFIDPEPPTK